MIHDPKKLLESALKPRSTEGTLGLLGTPFRFLPTVHLVAAVTKHGKTNFAANLVVHALEEYADGKVVVCLNEETAEDFLLRCGCILADVNFGRWKLGQLDPKQQEKLKAAVERVMDRIRIVDSEKVDLGCMEEVTRWVGKAARTATENGFRLVIFDYFQNVYKSKNRPGATPYELYKLLGVRLKDVGKKAQCPVVVFAQLKERRDEDDGGFKSRIEGDTWFANNVATGIELRADKRVSQSSLSVQIDRFQGMTHEVFWFDHRQSGRLVAGSPKVTEDDE